MGKWPAVDVTGGRDADLTLAIVDDFAPTAAEPSDSNLRIFFPTATARDAACAALRGARYRVSPVEVNDEDWARRSQEDLKPVTVDRIMVAPPWASPTPTSNPQSPTSSLRALAVVIQPSTGFGTGHHATTRLCLRALQAVNLADRSVLDVGTGSGVLAIAAARLGAARVLGIDCDEDAIRAARETSTGILGVEGVQFQVADVSTGRLLAADVVTANLTGAFLSRSSPLLLSLVRPGGTLIVSGLLEEERDGVMKALAGPLKVRVWEQSEDGWVALGMCCS